MLDIQIHGGSEQDLQCEVHGDSAEIISALFLTAAAVHQQITKRELNGADKAALMKMLDSVIHASSEEKGT